MTTPPPVSPPARWIHHDADLSRHTETASTRAIDLDWESDSLEERATDFQAMVAETAYLMARLQGKTSRVITPQGDETLYVDPRPADANVPLPRREAAQRLYRTLDILARGAEQSGDWETFAAEPPEAPIEAAGLPTVAVIAIVVVAGAAIAYCGHQAARVVDRQLARREQTARLVQNHAVALDVIDRHTEREDKAGKPLPLDEASRAVLDDLAKEQQTIAGTAEPDFGGPLGPSTPGDSPWKFGTGALVGLVLGVGLWLYTTGKG